MSELSAVEKQLTPRGMDCVMVLNFTQLLMFASNVASGIAQEVLGCCFSCAKSVVGVYLTVDLSIITDRYGEGPGFTLAT